MALINKSMKKVISFLIVGAIVIFCGGFIYYETLVVNANRNTENNLVEAKRIYDSIPIWHKKIQTEQDIKIGIITDTHVHPNRINKSNKADDAPRYLNKKDTKALNNFVLQMDKFQPEFIVHLGDVIEGTDDEDFVGIKGIQLVKKELEKANVPLHWVLGNHDLRSVTREQFKEAVGIDSITQTFDVDDYRFVILDANYNKENLPRTPEGNVYIPGQIPLQEIEWLKKQLDTDKRVFIFIHHGVFQDDTPGDIREDSGKVKMKQSIKNSDELQNILQEYRVDGLFNGHMEARRYGKVNYTNIYSLTGTKKSKTYPQSYYELTVTDGEPDLTMFYVPAGSTEVKQVDFESGEK